MHDAPHQNTCVRVELRNPSQIATAPPTATPPLSMLARLASIRDPGPFATAAGPLLLAALRRLCIATAPGPDDRDQEEEDAAWLDAACLIASITGKPIGIS